MTNKDTQNLFDEGYVDSDGWPSTAFEGYAESTEESETPENNSRHIITEQRFDLSNTLSIED